MILPGGSSKVYLSRNQKKSQPAPRPPHIGPCPLLPRRSASPTRARTAGCCPACPPTWRTWRRPRWCTRRCPAGTQTSARWAPSRHQRRLLLLSVLALFFALFNAVNDLKDVPKQLSKIFRNTDISKVSTTSAATTTCCLRCSLGILLCFLSILASVSNDVSTTNVWKLLWLAVALERVFR